MSKILIYLGIFISIASCSSKSEVDLIVFNGNIYTVNDDFDTIEAFDVNNGKFIDTGTNEQILSNYTALDIIDAKQQTVVPGLIDAHAHFMRLGTTMQEANLVGTESYDEMIQRVIDFQKNKNFDFIRGRGWDQNDWQDKQFPTKFELDKLFPNTPVALTRVDGHAALFNQAALDLGSVTDNSFVEGGRFIKQKGKLTGVLVDKAQGLVWRNWPKSTRADNIQALLAAQKECFKYGLSTVNDAGVERDIIELMDSLHESGDLKIRIYAMVAGGNKDNLDYYLERGPSKTDKLNIRSFKISADGALGSRGALLRKPYSDKDDTYGLPVTNMTYFNEAAQRIALSNYQLNTHAIGDSANHSVLKTYTKVLQGTTDRRWKVEHAQVVSPLDFQYFKNIIPSIQPTHATSDMYWAEERIGKDRMKGAYAYKKLLDIHGKVALGTDFPVEYVSPFYTFHAAVARQDGNNYPSEGFQKHDALTREETLRGMTIWAAYSNFEENEKGSIENGKFADFIFLDKNIMEVDEKVIRDVKVTVLFVGGEKQ